MTTVTLEDQPTADDRTDKSKQEALTDVPESRRGMEAPTFDAKVKLGNADTSSYANISITCEFREKAELRDWIIAATLRLMDDIRAKESTPVG